MADEVLRARLAEAMEETAGQRHTLSLQARAQEESHTSARVAARRSSCSSSPSSRQPFELEKMVWVPERMPFAALERS